MSENASEKSENRSVVMSALVEASSLVRRLAEPRPPGDSVRAAILRSARRLRGLSPSRVKDIWYEDDRVCVSGDELNELRRAAQHEQEAKASAEYVELLGRIAVLTARLDSIDPDFHREAVAGLRDALLQSGGMGSAVDRSEGGALK